MITLSTEEYLYHQESYDGLCINCWEWQDGGVEPDAENYPCDACGMDQVMGAEQAMVIGYIEIDDDDYQK